MRDCENCKHHILYDYKNMTYGCESWECKFEPKEQEPSTKNDLGVDCISRDDVRDVMQELWGTSGELMDRLMALPSVTPQEPRKGHWIADLVKWGDEVTTVDGYRCDKCNAFDSDKDNYCPNCGAKMEEAEE